MVENGCSLLLCLLRGCILVLIFVYVLPVFMELQNLAGIPGGRVMHTMAVGMFVIKREQTENFQKIVDQNKVKQMIPTKAKPMKRGVSKMKVQKRQMGGIARMDFEAEWTFEGGPNEKSRRCQGPNPLSIRRVCQYAGKVDIWQCQGWVVPR